LSESLTARRSVAALAVGGLLTGAVLTAPPASAAPGGPVKSAAKSDRLGSHDRELLADARADGESFVTIMVTARRGELGQAKRSLKALDATIRYAADKYDYLSARVAVGKVTKVAGLDSVRAVDLDEVVPIPKVTPQGATTAAATAFDAPDASTPDDNPYMPTRETGATAFKQAHSTWDGRGVTIGILDSGVDASHPALQTTSDGQDKMVDWFTATDPATEGSLVAGGDATWLPMVQDVSGPGVFPPSGQYRDAKWKIPAGTYKIRTFDEAGTNVAGCEVCGDVNRDGDTKDRFGVLYDPASHDIRVDSNDNKDFNDDAVMRPFTQDRDLGAFGKDDPRTDVREQMTFTVDYREDVDVSFFNSPVLGAKRDFVDIGIVSAEHGSHVAGITAANNMFGGSMDGAAPGAKLVSARACSFGPGCTAAALTDGMAELAANRGVDIINMSIGGLPALNDGNNARATLYNRIIADGVQLVISAGNSGNNLNTVGDPSVATDVVSVGATISDETWAANYGSKVSFDGIRPMTFSSGGPREDGGFKPNVTAPGSAISTIPTWLPGNPVPEAGYGLPAGYAMLNGTSMAAPQTAGGMALLISAAKAQGVDHGPAELRQAVYSSADFNGAIPAFLQGNGQLDLPKAWELLSGGLSPVAFTASAPVCTEIWKILGRTTGTGIYNRCAADAGGQAPGTSKTYPVSLTRTSGAAKPITYNLSLAGDTGNVSLGSQSVTLGRGKTTTVDVTVRTPASGAAVSAILKVDDAATRGLDFQVMNVVAAGDVVGDDFSKSWSGDKMGRSEPQRFYLTVPAGVKALQLKLSDVAASSQTRFLAFHPFGVGMESASSLVCYTNFQGGNGCNPNLRVYENPQPGVWEFLVESRRTSGTDVNPFTLEASLLGVTVDPATQTVPAGSQVHWSVTNDFGPVTATFAGGPLGSAKSSRESIADGATKEYTVDVPVGATRLDVSIGNTSDAQADLDLYVTDPAGNQRFDADGDSEESLTYQNPAPGTYKVLVDGFDVPAGTTQFDYLDVFFSSALGTLQVTDPAAPTNLGAGETRQVTGSLTAGTPPSTGRSVFGEMTVRSPDGALLGTGSVLVQ
jgi:subtilisin family serine protease